MIKCGSEKVTVVIGPLFVLASCLSIFRQIGWLSLDVGIPILVISTGLLLLLARLPAVPIPAWIIQESEGKTGR